jgi:DNA-binding protein
VSELNEKSSELEKTVPERSKASSEPNTILIGRKPPMTYVLAVMTHFNTPGTKEVTLKARGQAITTAVDVTEITKRRFLTNLKVDKVSIGTDVVPVQEGGTRNISTIEIRLIV